MTDESIHEQMERHAELGERLDDLRRERDDVAASVRDRLSEAMAAAVVEAGVSIEAFDETGGGRRFRFGARLDRAALVAALLRELPDGFYVSHVNEDGSLNIDWTGRRETPAKRVHGSILKAIVAEASVLDSDGFYTSVPTREQVIERAVELGIDTEDAADRLQRLDSLDVVDVASDGVYPDENFAMV